MFIKKAVAVITVVFLLIVSVGCSKSPQALQYAASNQYMSVSSMTVASNNNYELAWNNDAKFVSLKSLKTGNIWSTIPYNYYLSGGDNSNICSPLNITVVDTSSLAWEVINGYNESVIPGTVKSHRVENGIKVTYYFDNFKISVPVVYKLTEDSLNVTVDPNDIREDDNYLLTAVSVAPYLCSTENNTVGSYVFVPSGTGAILNATSDSRGIRRYSEEIYGEDYSRILTSDFIDDTAVRLPVFGIKSENSALLGIVENGAECVKVEAEVGSNRTGYSAVWATANIRGFDVYSATAGNGEMKRMSKEHSVTPVSVGYYPLDGDDANYNEMAKRYRRYLEDNNALVKTVAQKGFYGVTFYGGVNVSTNFMGIPLKTTKSMTTFAQAEEIARNLVEASELTPHIRLYGYGDNGIDSGKVAGGYDFPNVFGGNRQREHLESYCSKENIPLYTDFNLIRFSDSGKGFSYLFDAAKTASLHTADISSLLVPLRDKAPGSKSRLLKRNKLRIAVERLKKFVYKENVSGISLSGLGEYAYSDFSEKKYMTKNNMANDVTEYINYLRNETHTVVSGANSYAAATSDAIFETPTDNGNYDIFDADIPFYQLVFGGSKPMLSSALNLSKDFERSLMQAVSSGTGLSFALIYNFEPTYIQNQSGKFYASVFEDNKEKIAQTLKEYSNFYMAIAGKEINRYELLPNGVSKTVFENGVTVYANHSADEANSPVGILGKYGVSVMFSND